MRLTCPNCDAQYEVADNVIPEEGRDVQCSNCGTTWFQESAAVSEPLPEPEEAPIEEDVEGQNAVAPVEPDLQDEDAAAGVAPELPQEDAGSPAEDETGLPQSTVSDEAAQILREEAMRELKARLAEGPRLESQSDLGLQQPAPEPQMVDDAHETELPAAPPPPEPVPVPQPVDVPEPEPEPRPEPELQRREGVSRDPEVSTAVAAMVGHTRERLPDIEEINSTLDATSARSALLDDEDENGRGARRRRAGFRIGFIAAILVAVVGLGSYVFAPQIARSFPEMAPMMSDYVNRTDRARFAFNGWVSRTVQSLTETMNSVTSSDG